MDTGIGYSFAGVVASYPYYILSGQTNHLFGREKDMMGYRKEGHTMIINVPAVGGRGQG